MEITVNNEDLIPRLEVLRMTVYGARNVINEWAEKKDKNEFSGLLQAFEDFEDELEKYIALTEPILNQWQLVNKVCSRGVGTSF